MIASNLTAEREVARIAADADIDTVAPTGSGPGTWLFADREGISPEGGPSCTPSAARRAAREGIRHGAR